MPRFVILEHDWPHRHWDLMLECDGVLKTWRLSEPPTLDHPVNAEPIDDHRLAYLDYEGEVSGRRGTVKRWDWGEFEWKESSHGQLSIIVAGAYLNGELRFHIGDAECAFVVVNEPPSPK